MTPSTMNHYLKTSKSYDLSRLEQVTNYETIQTICSIFTRNLQFTPPWAGSRPYGLIKIGKLLRKENAPASVDIELVGSKRMGLPSC